VVTSFDVPVRLYRSEDSGPFVLALLLRKWLQERDTIEKQRVQAEMLKMRLDGVDVPQGGEHSGGENSSQPASAAAKNSS
jgi:hypothetical protein